MRTVIALIVFAGMRAHAAESCRTDCANVEAECRYEEAFNAEHNLGDDAAHVGSTSTATGAHVGVLGGLTAIRDTE